MTGNFKTDSFSHVSEELVISRAFGAPKIATKKVLTFGITMYTRLTFATYCHIVDMSLFCQREINMNFPFCTWCFNRTSFLS